MSCCQGGETRTILTTETKKDECSREAGKKRLRRLHKVASSDCSDKQNPLALMTSDSFWFREIIRPFSRSFPLVQCEVKQSFRRLLGITNTLLVGDASVSRRSTVVLSRPLVAKTWNYCMTR